MNKEVKKKWLAALRSGKYKQSTQRLKRDEGYCCLGVLCDIHSKETGTKWKPHCDTHFEGVEAYMGKTSFLPKAVETWAGLTKCAQVALSNGDTLWEVNDSQQKSFKQIADMIEIEL